MTAQQTGGSRQHPGSEPPAPERRRPYYAAYYDPYGNSPYYSQGSGFLSDLTLERIVRILRQKWLTIIAAVLFAVGVGALYCVFVKKVYRATALLELSVRRPRIAGQQGAVLDDAYAAAFQPEEVFFVTRLEKFKGILMLQKAAAKIRERHDISRWSEEQLHVRLRRRVSMNLLRRSRLVQIRSDFSDPVLATTIANAFAEAAEELALEENKQTSDDAVQWLQMQAQSQRKALEAHEQALVEFRSRNQVDVLESRQKVAQQALEDFNRTLTQIESDEMLARDLYETLASLELHPESAGRLPASIPRSGEIQAMLENWLRAISERDALLSKYTAEHPEVQAHNKVIEVLREQALDAIRRGKETAKSNLELYRKQAESLRGRILEQSKVASDLELQIVQKKTELTSLQRERDAADISYKGILNRIEEARLSADENTATVKIVERSTIPMKPIRPKVKRVLALAAAIGLLLGLALAFVLDILEDYIGSTGEVERVLGLKVMGVLPQFDAAGRTELATTCLNDRFSKIAEAIAGVRAMLETPLLKELGPSVLVASTAPEEGKTITACNLAIMFAKSGVKTLLVDFDMRRPRINRIFTPPENAESLSHVLDNRTNVEFNKLPYSTGCDNLDAVMSRSADDISPADFIGGTRVKEFLAWANDNYERVIVDSPPFGIISDSAVLASMVGCVILVCRPHRSRRRAVRRLISHFRDINATVAGVVINGAPKRSGAIANYFDSYHGPLLEQPVVSAADTDPGSAK